MSVNDVMNTDWHDLLAVIGTSDEEAKEEVIDLSEFIQGL